MATHAPPARHLIWGWTNIGGHHISNACISWKERKRREDTELGERERERCCTPLPPTTPQGPLPFSNHLVPISGVDRTAATHLRTLVNRAAKMDFEKWASGMESNRSVNRNRLSKSATHAHATSLCTFQQENYSSPPHGKKDWKHFQSTRVFDVANELGKIGGGGKRTS